MSYPIIFHAALCETSCIKVDGDGTGRATFTVADSDRDALKALIDLKGKPLSCTVETEEHENLIYQCVMCGTSCIKIDGQGGGRVTFTLPVEEREALKSLIDHVSTALTVTVEGR